MIGRAALERDLLIVACAVSAGIHAALHPEVEPVEGLALLTKAVELVGVGAAVAVLEPGPIFARPKGTLA